MRVHVVGNVCVDTTFWVERFPAPGETLIAISSSSSVGGKGANQAMAVARAGAEVTLHAAVGRDEAAGQIRVALRDNRLALDFLDGAGHSDTSMILVRGDGENLIVSDTGKARSFDPLASTNLADTITRNDIVLLQGNLDPAVTVACLRLARQKAAFTVLNPSPLTTAPISWSLVDLVVANRGEVEVLAGNRNVEAAAAVLLAQGAGHVVVTLGDHGVLLLDEAGITYIKAPKVEAIDTSGAGDVLCGVAVGLIAQGVAVEVAFARAAAAAALSVTRKGTLASCPSAGEIASLPQPSIHRRPS
jgi:ribokinase